VQQLASASRIGDPEIPPKFLPCRALTKFALLAHKLHSVLCPATAGHRSGCHLWNLMGSKVVGQPKRTLLPVLTALFVISYGLLTMLVVEQGRTIDSQRSLIGLLFTDSVQLSSLQGKAVQKKNAERAKSRGQMKSQATPQNSQGPNSSSPATPRAHAKSPGSSKLRRPLPQKPPRDTSGEGDERRTLVSI
jgi:hypothetical protein